MMNLIDDTNGTLLPSTAQAFANEIQRSADTLTAVSQGFSAVAYQSVTSYSWRDTADRLIEIFARKTSDITPLQACGQGAR